jgi:hypothetical protein
MAGLRDRLVEKRTICSPGTGKCAEIEVMFDSGSTHSLIRKDVLDRKFPDATVVPSNRIAEGFDKKSQTPSLGQVVLTVEIEKGKPPAQELFDILPSLTQEAVFGASGMETNEVNIEMRHKKDGGSIVRFRGKGPAPIRPGGIEFVEGRP